MNFEDIPGVRSKRAIENFWDRVVISAKPDACWKWTGKKSKTGYGKTSLIRGCCLAHRTIWLLMKGPIPEGKCVLHTCDQRDCVRPEHLFLGDQTDNIKDMVSKGRQRGAVGDNNASRKYPERRPRGDNHFLRKHPEAAVRGEKQHLAKLNAEKVLDIRNRFAKGEAIKTLANEYGVDPSTLKSVVERVTWKHVL